MPNKPAVFLCLLFFKLAIRHRYDYNLRIAKTMLGRCVKEWHQTLMVQGLVLALLSPIIFLISRPDGVAFALGSGLMFLSYAVSAMVHFKGSKAPTAQVVFMQAMKAVVLRFCILIVGIMLTLRYLNSTDWLFFMIGLISAQQFSWLVPFWRAWKGKD